MRTIHSRKNISRQTWVETALILSRSYLCMMNIQKQLERRIEEYPRKSDKKK
jgi:hypothetical protein